MKNRLFFLVAGVLSASLVSASNQYILRYTESEPLSNFLNSYGLVLAQSVAGRPIHAVVDPLNRNPETLIQQISDDTDDDVSIELDQIVKLPIHSFVTNQEQGISLLRRSISQNRATDFYGVKVPLGFLRQNAVQLIGAAPSWEVNGIGTGIVAVIDTGVDRNHAIFRQKLVPGIDFLTPGGNGSELTGLGSDILSWINPTTTPILMRQVKHTTRAIAPALEPQRANDPRLNSLPFALGHGTMVAGAVLMVAPGAKILPIRAFGQDGTASLFTVIRSIHAAEDRGARIVNLSLNTYVYSREFERTTEEVSDRGVILVASTGNDGRTDEFSYPASFPKVTGVASVDVAGNRSLFSNAGPALAWVAAPGEAVMLPYPGGRWAGGWGTSFAAPTVSGLAAKLLSRKPDATYSDLQSVLGRSTPLGDPNLGLGLLNVLESISGF